MNAHGSEKCFSQEDKMGKKFKIQSQLRLYLQWPILLSVFVMAANLVAGALSPRAGLAMSGFTLLYIMIAMWLFLYRRT